MAVWSASAYDSFGFYVKDQRLSIVGYCTAPYPRVIMFRHVDIVERSPAPFCVKDCAFEDNLTPLASTVCLKSTQTLNCHQVMSRDCQQSSAYSFQSS